MGARLPARVTTLADVDGVVGTITSAFLDDPLWSLLWSPILRPANNDRYASVGFRPVGGFTTATGEVVTTMWRDAR